MTLSQHTHLNYSRIQHNGVVLGGQRVHHRFLVLIILVQEALQRSRQGLTEPRINQRSRVNYPDVRLS